MKKLWQEPKYKRFRRRAEKRALNRLWYVRDLRRHERRAEIGVSRERLRSLARLKHGAGPVRHVTAPEIFSFVDNPEGVSRFVESLERCLANGNPVFVNLDGVRRMECDAVAILLSVLVRFQNERIKFSGSLPADRTARADIIQMNFFDRLFAKQFRKDDSYDLAGNPVHWQRKVDPELSAELIEEASKMVWGEIRRCPMVYRAFIELMGNTNNHAALNVQGEKHWYVTTTYVPAKSQVQFSFVDYGVGVFQSLEQKRTGRFVGILGKLRSKVGLSGNPPLLEQILIGEAHRTATGEEHRGKGLPSIFHSFRDNGFSEFVMITNDAIYDSRTGSYRTLSPPFAGTFVYWTLNKDNRSLPRAA